MPLYEPAANPPDKKQVEKGLLQSLSILAKAYQFTPMQVKDKPYPYNILLSCWHAKTVLLDGNKDTRLWVELDSKGRAAFATTDTVETGTTLYYIPVIPLYRALQERETRRAAELLLSVCSYLYKIAGIPYYRDEDAYLNWHYEMLADWITEDIGSIDREDYLSQKSGLDRAAYYGDMVGKRMCHPYQLHCFEHRVQAFVPHSQWETDSLKVARIALELWQQNPQGHLLRHAPDTWEEDEDSEPPIRIYEYISFIAETKGSLFESLSEMVNNEFNEKAQIDEPAIVTRYDCNKKGKDNLDFERSLLDLISDLCDVLNDIA